MSDHSLMEIVPRVKTLVDTCAGVKQGERVLIITDTGWTKGSSPPSPCCAGTAGPKS